MTNYGFVASGGGYRSFYSAGALVWLHQQGRKVVHIASTSSGNNISLDYLLWDAEHEELPPVLTRTMRLSVTDIFHVFANFLGLRPTLLPTGSHLFTVDKDSCRKSLLLDDPKRRDVLAENLAQVRWDILATNLTKRRRRYFDVNAILKTIDAASLDAFMDAFLAGITTIPYFKAIEIDGDYYVEGGYLDNTPMSTMFQDDAVDEIIACDFHRLRLSCRARQAVPVVSLQPAVQQHRHSSARLGHAADAAERPHLRRGRAHQRAARGDGQGQGHPRRPHLYSQADPHSPPEEP